MGRLISYTKYGGIGSTENRLQVIEGSCFVYPFLHASQLAKRGESNRWILLLYVRNTLEYLGSSASYYCIILHETHEPLFSSVLHTGGKLYGLSELLLVSGGHLIGVLKYGLKNIGHNA